MLGSGLPTNWIEQSWNGYERVSVPVGLASQLAAQALAPRPGSAHGLIQLNAGLHGCWNWDVNSNAGDCFDAATVLLHEALHSMGFSGRLRATADGKTVNLT